MMGEKEKSAQRAVAKTAQHYLDIGCGPNKHPGAVGMDRRKLDGVDVVHDIEEFPWPFPDETFDKVLASHVIEHLKPWLMIDLMNEIWRVTKVGGQLLVAMPYAGSPGFYQDPTHIKTWNENTPLYFDPAHGLYGIYEPKPWQIKVNSWHSDGNLEVVFAKRAE